MNAKYLAFNDSADSEVIENFCAVLPWVDVTVFAHSLLVEAVNRGNSSGFVITSQKSDAVGVLQLKTEQKLESLDRVVASIDEVTHEDVAGIRNLATFFKKLEEVVELTMNITADSDGSADRLDIALFNEDLLDLFTENAQVSLGQDSSVLDSSEPRVDVVFSGHFLYLVLLLSCDACAFAANNL